MCELLGVEVPEGPFPRVNDTKGWQAYMAKTKMKGAMSALKVVGGVGVVVVVVGVYFGLRGWGQ